MMNSYLEKLKSILKKDQEKFLFPCIEEFLTSGPVISGLADKNIRPSRQDITQFLAFWFKYVGKSHDECLTWMTDYCIEVLSSISHSSKSQILHSTKSNLKYVYKSDAVFICGCEENILRINCDPACIVYKEMQESYKKKNELAALKADPSTLKESIQAEIDNAPIQMKVKDIYLDQFKEAFALIEQSLKDNVSKTDIISILNKRGYKTRTGKKWTAAILSSELRAHQKNPDKT